MVTGRLRLARCVVDDPWPLRRAADRFQVSVTTAARWSAGPRLAMAVRRAFCDDLTGPGVSTLRALRTRVTVAETRAGSHDGLVFANSKTARLSV